MLRDGTYNLIVLQLVWHEHLRENSWNVRTLPFSVSRFLIEIMPFLNHLLIKTGFSPTSMSLLLNNTISCFSVDSNCEEFLIHLSCQESFYKGR